MQVQQLTWNLVEGWQVCEGDSELDQSAQLVLAFGSRQLLENPQTYETIQERFPNAKVLSCSTSGQIRSCGEISDDLLCVTAIHFEHTPFIAYSTRLEEHGNSYEAGKFLGQALNREGLSHVLVFSDGHLVNGTALARGLNSGVNHKVTITGGLAGDGSNFERTLTGLDAPPTEGQIVAIGLLGKRIQVGFGCQGGWNPFGPLRKITKSEDNKLFEIDDRNALELYKHYLGSKAEGLPETGLLFPIALYTEDGKTLVRTLLAADEEEQSLTFAGEVPVGATVQLMRANLDHLVDGASVAANHTSNSLANTPCDLALLISCVGRRLVLGPRVDEEIEEVRDVLKPKNICGFYSYGEISPMEKGVDCRLHNQTMTVTGISER